MGGRRGKGENETKIGKEAGAEGEIEVEREMGGGERWGEGRG